MRKTFYAVCATIALATLGMCLFTVRLPPWMYAAIEALLVVGSFYVGRRCKARIGLKTGVTMLAATLAACAAFVVGIFFTPDDPFTLLACIVIQSFAGSVAFFVGFVQPASSTSMYGGGGAMRPREDDL